MKNSQKIPKYNFRAIERKWQKRWQEDKTFQLDLDKVQKPFYNLMMFPYPSAEGLHVGGVYTFTGVDTFGRYKRMKGFDVFEPIGLDGFGIHSENYAMKIGQHIKDVSLRTEKNFYRQLHSIGNMYDWSRTVETYKPEYYKWTQWLFLQMYKQGLAYRKKAKVNWCPSCKTVLSDEQVIAGKCERCDSEVAKKELSQWFFAITKYADRLLKNLDWIDWPEDVKLNQRNWIGKSEGALIKFQITNSKLQIKSKSQISNSKNNISTNYKLQTAYCLEVFTTRPDTLFGATYMVVAPEHKLISNFKFKISNFSEVDSYVKKALGKSEQERKADEKEKTGVEIKGIRATNPATGKEIPIFVADYVLADYGTGAIMAVPAHDQRDFDFARKYDLPIVEVVEPLFVERTKMSSPRKDLKFVERHAVTSIIKHWEEKKYLVLKWKKVDWNTFVTGGREKCQTAEESARREVLEETGFKNLKLIKKLGRNHSKFFHNPKQVNRFAHFEAFYFELENGEKDAVSKDEKAKHNIFWVAKEDVEKTITIGDQIFFFNKIFTPQVFTENGILVNSGKFDGMESRNAKKEIIKWLEKKGFGKKAVDFKLRDWCISRQRYWGPPIPIVYCNSCAIKKQKFVFFHAYKDNKDAAFWPWLKKELEKNGHKVVFNPSLPGGKNPDIEKQLKFVLKKYEFDENTVIVTHSLGGVLAMKLLPKLKSRISKLIMVAPPLKAEFLDGKKREPLEKYCDWKFDFKKIKERADKIIVLRDKKDHIVPADQTKEIARKLSAELVSKVGNETHFDGTKEPEILSVINSILQATSYKLQAAPIPVPEKDLPVKLPPMEDFLPEGKGKGPLAKNEKFVKTKCPECGGSAERETDVSDPFVDSAWYFFRYPSTEFHDKPFDKKRTKKWLPVDSYIGGKEHTVLHLLYSRFVTMVLKDLGYIDFEEPYKRFFGHGLITKDGAKMSKSKGNVVNPDEMIEKYGADTTRLYLRFLGDFSQGGDWRDSGAAGMHRFVKRLWTVFHELDNCNGKGAQSDSIIDPSPSMASEGKARLVNISMVDKTIKGVGDDIEKLSFNTAVAKIMEFVNWTKENRASFNMRQAKRIRETLALVLAPMAPHLAEEMWFETGNKKSVFESRWPKYDPKNLVEEEVELAVQVNGKLRDTVKVAKDIEQKDAEQKALEGDRIKKYLAGKKVFKIIYVPGRIINIVAK